MNNNNNQSVIRGAAAFFIIITHISAFTESNCLFRAFSEYGYFWVAIFFFYSGFNLINSYIKKKDDFFKKFWYKKITRIYIPFIISNTLFVAIQHYFNNVNFELKDVFQYILGIKCINDVNWYIYAIVLFYVSAWSILFIFNKIKKIKDKKIALAIVSTIIFVLYGILYYNVAMPLHLTTSIRNIYPVTLILGMIISLYYDKVKKFFENKTRFEIIVIILFFIQFLLHYANMKKIELDFLNLEMLDFWAPQFFAMMVMLISLKVNLHSKICVFIDKISLETYTFHFVILNLFYNETFKITNSYQYLFVYFVTVIVISYITRKIVEILFYRKKKCLKEGEKIWGMIKKKILKV